MNPRENFDCWLGNMVCWHNRYTLGDEQPGEDPRRWLHEWRRGRKEKDFVILPLYLYDHSGITMSTSSFSCPWDSGQVGYIIATRERAAELGIVWDRNAIADILQAEVREYDQYLTGDIYGFNVEEKMPCGHWEDTDSCWGFYGTDWEANGLADAVGDPELIAGLE